MINKWTPIRYSLFTWTPLVLILEFPNLWWGILIKIVSAILLLIAFKTAFHPTYPSSLGIGVFVVLNTLWFGLAWFFAPPINYIFAFLLIVNFWNIYRQIKNYYKGLDT